MYAITTVCTGQRALYDGFLLFSYLSKEENETVVSTSGGWATPITESLNRLLVFSKLGLIGLCSRDGEPDTSGRAPMKTTETLRGRRGHARVLGSGRCEGREAAAATGHLGAGTRTMTGDLKWLSEEISLSAA